MGRYRSGQPGQTVNLLAYAFAGSNPARPTTPHHRVWPTQWTVYEVCPRGSVVEHVFGKDEVMGSIPIVGSTIFYWEVRRGLMPYAAFVFMESMTHHGKAEV